MLRRWLTFILVLAISMLWVSYPAHAVPVPDEFSQAVQSTKNAIGNLTDQATNSVATRTKSAIDRFGTLASESEQSFNQWTTSLNQSVSGLNEATAKLKTSLLEETSGAVNTITEATNRATSSLKATTEQATGALNKATDVAVHQFNDATSSITQTAEKTKLALDETLHKAEQLSETISLSVRDLIVNSMKDWMTNHPIVAWLLAHPLGSLAIGVLVLFLGWNLLKAIGQFTQQAFLLILQSPLKLIQSLSQGAFQSLNRANPLPTLSLNAPPETQKRLADILDRLEVLRKEQETLMQEMHAILLSKR